MATLNGCDAIVMIAASEIDSNLYYATGFLAPDPFIFIQSGDEKILVMSDLEVDRARTQGRVDTVLSYSAYEASLKETEAKPPGLLDVLEVVLRERKAHHLLVPGNFGIEHADSLRA